MKTRIKPNNPWYSYIVQFGKVVDDYIYLKGSKHVQRIRIIKVDSDFSYFTDMPEDMIGVWRITYSVSSRIIKPECGFSQEDFIFSSKLMRETL